MRDPFARGYPDDLPVRPSTSAHFDWMACRRNLFDLRLPETLRARNVGLITMPIREEVSLEWEWQDESLASRLQIEGRVSLRARFSPCDGGVQLALAVHNLSGRDWKGVRAAVCMCLIAAPDFADVGRVRTFWWRAGRWRQLQTGFPHISLEPRIGSGGLRFRNGLGQGLECGRQRHAAQCVRPHRSLARGYRFRWGG